MRHRNKGRPVSAGPVPGTSEAWNTITSRARHAPATMRLVIVIRNNLFSLTLKEEEVLWSTVCIFCEFLNTWGGPVITKPNSVKSLCNGFPLKSREILYVYSSSLYVCICFTYTDKTNTQKSQTYLQARHTYMLRTEISAFYVLHYYNWPFHDIVEPLHEMFNSEIWPQHRQD